jgi:hypothetical protein
MNTGEDEFATASVVPDGTIVNWDDKPQGLGRFDAGDQTFWFTKDLRFDANEHDFWVVVKYFGFRSRDFAGNKDRNGRHRFTAKQAAAIRQRLTDYYSGDEDKIVFPFNERKCRFLGVIFESSWILKN